MEIYLRHPQPLQYTGSAIPFGVVYCFLLVWAVLGKQYRVICNIPPFFIYIFADNYRSIFLSLSKMSASQTPTHNFSSTLSTPSRVGSSPAPVPDSTTSSVAAKCSWALPLAWPSACLLLLAQRRAMFTTQRTKPCQAPRSHSSTSLGVYSPLHSHPCNQSTRAKSATISSELKQWESFN